MNPALENLINSDVDISEDALTRLKELLAEKETEQDTKRIDVQQSIRDCLKGGGWLSLPELTLKIYGHKDKSSYNAVGRAARKLAEDREIIRRDGSEGLRFAARADVPTSKKDWKLYRQPPKWYTHAIWEWWTEEHGTHENVFNLRGPLDNPRTGETSPPTTTWCSWTTIWENAGGHYDENWFLDVVNKSDELLFFEARDYCRMGIFENELMHYVMDLQPGDKIPGHMKDLIGRSRQRRMRVTSSWNYSVGRRAIGSTPIAPRWREGWSPLLEDRAMIEKYGEAKVANWSWAVISRLYQEGLKSPSNLRDCVSLGYPITELVGMSDSKILEVKNKLLANRSI